MDNRNSEEPLHIRLRPKSFDEVVGQDAVLNSLKQVLSKPDRPHAYCFYGPSGSGKTTLARLIGPAINAGTFEWSAAQYSGIKDIRDWMRHSRAHPDWWCRGQGKESLLYIIDECQALTKPAWNVALSWLEEPLPWVYFALCTTQPTAIPTAVMSRSAQYSLDPIDEATMRAQAEKVIRAEDLHVPSELLGALVQRARGDLRHLLILLAQSEKPAK